MRELESEEAIMRVPNSSLAFYFKDVERNFPPYPSRATKTPADYGLKEDNPRLYLCLNSKESQDHLRTLKSRREANAERAYRAVGYEKKYKPKGISIHLHPLGLSWRTEPKGHCPRGRLCEVPSLPKYRAARL